MDAGTEYMEYVAGKTDEAIRYGEYVAGKTDEAIRYSEYAAEKIEESIKFGNYLAEKMNQTIGYAEHIAEHADNSIRYGEYLAENVASKEDFQNLTEYAEYMFENSGSFTRDGKSSDVSEEKKENRGLITHAVKESVSGRYESLDSKIQAVLESVQKQKADMKLQDSRYPFMQFLSEGKKAEFIALNETEKKRVANALDAKPAFDEERIVAVWESALASVEVNEKWLTEMPVEFLPLWESATADTKARINRQAKMYRLETSYQITNFWQTRGLGKPSEVTGDVNESVRKEDAAGLNPLGYSPDFVSNIADSLGQRFKK